MILPKLFCNERASSRSTHSLTKSNPHPEDHQLPELIGKPHHHTGGREEEHSNTHDDWPLKEEIILT